MAGRVAGKTTSSNLDAMVVVMLRLNKRPGSTPPIVADENGSSQLGVVLKKSKEEACVVGSSGVGGTETFGAKGL